MFSRILANGRPVLGAIKQTGVNVKRYQSSMDEYEQKIYQILAKELDPKNLEVRDVSGGCGSMFSIDIESDKFKGMTMIKQHRLVNQILKEDINKWHGLQLKTKIPK